MTKRFIFILIFSALVLPAYGQNKDTRMFGLYGASISPYPNGDLIRVTSFFRSTFGYGAGASLGFHGKVALLFDYSKVNFGDHDNPFGDYSPRWEGTAYKSSILSTGLRLWFGSFTPTKEVPFDNAFVQTKVGWLWPDISSPGNSLFGEEAVVMSIGIGGGILDIVSCMFEYNVQVDSPALDKLKWEWFSLRLEMDIWGMWSM